MRKFSHRQGFAIRRTVGSVAANTGEATRMATLNINGTDIAVDADPTTRNATDLRLPRTPPPGIYRGLTVSMGRTTTSIFGWWWGIGALLSHASGRHLAYVGESTCPPARPGPLEIVVRREGDTVHVCY